jgi:hypothetical protein
MKSRRTLLAILGGIAAFAIVVGSAASLGGLSSTSLGADDQVVASCDTDGVTTSYSTTYTATPTPGFKVGNVTVGGIDPACVGKSMTVTLVNASNASIGTTTQAVTTDAGFINVVSLSSSNALAESVTGIHIVING